MKSFAKTHTEKEVKKGKMRKEMVCQVGMSLAMEMRMKIQTPRPERPRNNKVKKVVLVIMCLNLVMISLLVCFERGKVFGFEVGDYFLLSLWEKVYEGNSNISIFLKVGTGSKFRKDE